MTKEKKGISKFAHVMVLLSVIAVLLGVGVFYWLMQFPAARSVDSISDWRKPAAKIERGIE